MPLPKKLKNRRIGPKEKKLFNKFLNKIKKYRIEWSMKNKKETYWNSRLYGILFNTKFDVINRKFPETIFVGEKFRPDIVLNTKKRKLCAVECKLIREKNAKGKYKEGLSQALLYSQHYKTVILLYYDFTNDSRYYNAFKKQRSTARKLGDILKLKNKIYIIVIKPYDR